MRRGIGMKCGKTWLTYEEQLKRKEMTKRKIMTELMRELMIISILIGCIPDHIFGLKKDNLICSIFVRYIKTIFTKQCTTLSLAGRRFIFLMCNGLIPDLGGKFRQKRIYLF